MTAQRLINRRHRAPVIASDNPVSHMRLFGTHTSCTDTVGAVLRGRLRNKHSGLTALRLLPDAHRVLTAARTSCHNLGTSVPVIDGAGTATACPRVAWPVGNVVSAGSDATRKSRLAAVAARADGGSELLLACLPNPPERLVMFSRSSALTASTMTAVTTPARLRSSG